MLSLFSTAFWRCMRTTNNIEVTFKMALQQSYDLAFGCDGMHSAVEEYGLRI